MAAVPPPEAPQKYKTIKEYEAEEAARLKEEAEKAKKAAEEAARKAELRRRHNIWLSRLNNQTAKSVFIFNDVKIGVHNYLDDSFFTGRDEFFCQEGNISYNRKLFDFRKLTFHTEDNVTTFSNGRIFTRSGDFVIGNDGSFFIDPVPSHLHIDRDFEFENSFVEKYEIATKERKEKRTRFLKTGLKIGAAALAVGSIVGFLANYLSSPPEKLAVKPKVQPTYTDFFLTTKADLLVYVGDKIYGKMLEGSCVSIVSAPSGAEDIVSAIAMTERGSMNITVPGNVLGFSTVRYASNCKANIIVTPTETVKPAVIEEAAPSKPFQYASLGYHIVTADQLNLRAGPGTEHSVKGALMRGSCVKAEQSRQNGGGFVQVFADTTDKRFQRGFVSEQYLKPAPEGTTSSNCFTTWAPK